MDYAESTFRQRLAFKREDAKVTQGDMAAHLGISQPWLSAVENGKQPWHWEWYEAYCHRLGITVVQREKNPLQFRIPARRGRKPLGAGALSEQVCIPLSAEHLRQLDTLAGVTGLSKPEIVRTWLENAWQEFEALSTTPPPP